MHTAILKRCGVVLIIVGLADVAVLIWHVATGSSYGSSVNVFAIIAGVLLLRGSLKTARIVAQVASFMLAAGVMTAAVMPAIYPVGYWLAMWRSDARAIGLALAVALVYSGLLLWVRQQVLGVEVIEAESEAGLPPPNTKVAMALGLVLPVVVLAGISWLLRGETAREAIRRAEQQNGTAYSYVLTRLQTQSSGNEKNVSATVVGYNAKELKAIEVTWKQ